MLYRILLIAAALNGSVFGLLFVVLPDATTSLFGGELDAFSSLLVRQFGGTILGIAIFDWLLRWHADRSVRRAVVTANATTFTIVAVVAAYAGVSGTANALVWVVASFHAVVAIGLVASYRSFSSAGIPRAASA